MYSGTTFRTKSGRMMGAHQRIDRVARRNLARTVGTDIFFPSIKDILHFEGKHGPDGIKGKSPGQDEPWHFIDPYHEGDHTFFDGIADHIFNLSVALKQKNSERAAFEGAWLAHAIVDGLTPAHHYPYEEHLEEIRGEGMETRTRRRDKIWMPGDTKRDMLKNNWRYWGAKGLMTTHLAFELGVAATLASKKFDVEQISEQDLARLDTDGFEAILRDLLRDIADLRMYESFYKTGWTRKLAKQTRDVLLPDIIKAVTLGWLAAIKESR